MNCGRVELFMPQELINKKIEQKRIAEERRQAEEKRKREEERLRNRMQELEQFLQDENHGLSLFECYDMTEKLYKEVKKIATEINNFLNEGNSYERKQI